MSINKPKTAVPKAVENTIKAVVKALIDPINLTPYNSAHVDEPKTFAKPLDTPINPRKKNEETGDFIKPNDPVAFFEAKEQRVRERFVNIAEAKILREQVRQCYYKSGVNHYQYVFIIISIYLHQYFFISTFIL